VYYAILLLLILGELLGERNYIIIIFPEYDTLESSDIYLTWRHTPSLNLSDSVSGLSLFVSDSGSIVSQLATSAPFSTPQQILSSELSDSDSILSFLTSSSVPRVPESPVKLELLDSLSRLGSNLSLESLY